MLELWFKVLETVVGDVEIPFLQENVIKVIKDMPSMKNPLPKRKRGNRLVFTVSKNIGEKGLDKEPTLIKLF